MFKRFILVLSTAVLILSLGLPASAQGAGGTIAGKLTNGTGGGSSVSDVEVRLETYVNSIPAANATARTQNDGSFKFDNLVTDPQNTYNLALLYQEVDYVSSNIAFGAGETSRSENITVYDSTDNVDAIIVDTAHTIIVPGDGVLEFTVVYDFINSTDRAFVGTGEPMANGKKKTLTFTLPADATEVQYGDGLQTNYVYPGHGGFIDTMAVLPGYREIVYGYKVAYDGGSYNFKEKMNYPADWFNLLIEGTGIKVTSDQLIDQGPVELMPGTSYVYLVGQNFTIGQVVSATLTGLSGTANQTLIMVLAAAAIVLILGGGLAYWRMRTRRNLQPVENVVGEKEDEQGLLIELARLDDDFAAGRIAEDAYRVHRAAKKARLVKLMSGNRG
ncbi:MAG: hypothetical protein Q7R50_00680 [Dehalococcoidales bacterium]|nr:hypothetical protein [Dehalococcoidales bacterium]